MKRSLNLSTGNMTDAVRTALRSEYNVVASPRLTIDWNLNRYYNPIASHTPSEEDEGYDIERFPIESIVEPLRPSKGISKAKVNEATVSPGYLKQKGPRFYVSDTADVYKYWTSQYPTNNSGNFSSPARPRITYETPVRANKIVIKLENTWASPKDYSVRVSSSTTGNVSVVGGNNPAINGAEGTLTLWFNGTAWVSNRPNNPVATNVGIIEFYVTSMGPGIKRNGDIMSYRIKGNWDGWVPTTGAKSSLNVIAIEAHLEADLTDRLITTQDTFDMGEASQLYPLGTITTNVGTVVLSNEDGIFNPENNSSIYKNLIEPNAELNLVYIYTIAGVEHLVQQFRMYASNWSNSENQTTIELEDYSKYLKEIKPNSWMVENTASSEIVWRVLDSVGFVDYEIQEDDLLEETVIPVFWTDGEKTAWEILDELAQATQTAIYIDCNGMVQVRTREAAFKDKNDMDWNLLGEKSGTMLPDIISWSPEAEYEANKIEVKYKTTKWKVNSQGKPAMSKVWEPDEETLVVRSSQLIRTIDANSTHIFLDQKEVLIWPFVSKVQIDGEIIQFNGKQFVYYTYTELKNPDGTPRFVGETKKIANVTSNDEYIKFNRMTPQRYRHMNHFTGGLKIEERAVWNSEKRNHFVDLNGWSTKLELSGPSSNSYQNNPQGMRHDKGNSTMNISTPKSMDSGSDVFWALRGGAGFNSYKSYGTRFKFNRDSAYPNQIAGLAYQLSGARESGYYIEVRTSASISATERSNINEIAIYSRVNGGGNLIGKGYATAIGEGIWYDMDVYHSGSGNNQKINVFINGQLAATGNTSSGTAQSESGRFGFYARGKTNVDFEYIYAIARNVVEPRDDFGFFDLKYGGIRGGQWEREHVWEMRSRRIKIRKKKWKKEEYQHNQYVFDEFSPYVHEVREFDVKFDPTPVRSSYIFNTNEWFSAVPEYTSTPFGAKFVIANSGRIHAVLKGEDRLVYAGAAAGVNQACVVLGQNLEIADEESVTRTNQPAVRSRGLIESELSSNWIQSKTMARVLADWMAVHWSDSVDEATVEIFGNPLIEVGDIVDVTYSRENMSPGTHKYFVVGASNSYENGIKTTLTLRRRRRAISIS